ncbi:MAG TPA: SEC-C metal-binding domain-containing protein, partial [Planctomycetota bacterium]|nr:SEC-C metal-binding domain-containing protein [Planctomycetota bacterium]
MAKPLTPRMSKPDENVYRACPCGSGQKYKFCCLDKDRADRRILDNRGGFDTPELLLDAAEEAHRKGGSLISQMRGREAIPFLERAIQLIPSIPFPHNNLALAQFMEGDIEKALEICERVDRVIDPGNVFALGQRVHYLLLQGRRKEAEETGRRILTLPGRDESAVYKKCEALARLRLHREVHDTAIRGMPLAHENRESLAFFAGTAAANLTDYDEAERLLSEAAKDLAHGRQARAHLERLRRRQGPGTLSGEWPYLEWGHWTMPRFLDRLKAHPDEMKRYPGFVETITCVLDDRLEDGAILNVLGMLGTPEAIDLLKRIAQGTFGTERMRLEAVSILVDCGTLKADVPLQMWIEGQWRMVRPQRQELSSECASPLPEELREEMLSMLDAMKTYRWARAVALGRSIVAKAPNAPQALFNLAMALRQHG